VDEAAIYRELWTERDPRVPARRQIDAEGRPTVDDIAAYIATERGVLAIELKETGAVLGYCGLIFDDDEDAPHQPELAFELLRAVHGHGYATEAGQALVTWAGETGFEQLWATVWDWNVASRRVLEKLGFRHTGEVERKSEHGNSLITVRELT
jgi:RimJ/RimL family protein N-acetyltransferase